MNGHGENRKKTALIAAIAGALVLLALLVVFLPRGRQTAASPAASGGGETAADAGQGAAAEPEQTEEEPFEDPFGDLHVGDEVSFGRLCQQARSTEVEPIVWRVLALEDGKALLISKYALDGRTLHNEFVNVRWEDSDLRAWLNGSFFETAFTENERALILTSVVKSETLKAKVFTTVRDKLFLLSVSEARDCFSSNEDRLCEPTDYANKHGAVHNENTPVERKTADNYCWWLLRTPGYDERYAAQVNDEGKIDLYGYGVEHKGGVRPAMWVSTRGPVSAEEQEAAAAAAEAAFLSPEAAPAVTSAPVRVRRDDGVLVGAYPRSANATDKQRDRIDWRVVKIDGDRALLVCEEVLDWMSFSASDPRAGWEDSDLRAWLNGEFLSEYFSETERSAMLEWDTTGGGCKDRMFLLSADEVNTLFYYRGTRLVSATPYAQAHGAPQDDVANEQGSLWWLRSGSKGCAEYVDEKGDIQSCRNEAERCGVRPAFWLDLNSPALARAESRSDWLEIVG